MNFSFGSPDLGKRDGANSFLAALERAFQKVARVISPLERLPRWNFWIGDVQGVPTTLKNNFGATAAPTTGDDSADGYAVGSKWIDVTNDKAYVCLDATATAAVWTEITAGVGAGGTELKGLTFTSDTDSTADSDPGNGLFKWDNATQSSATTLYFDNQTADAVSVATFWAALGSEGYIYLQQGDDSTKWQLWKWSAVTDGTGYRKFTVTLQAYASAITDAKTVYCVFFPLAAAGASADVPTWVSQHPDTPPSSVNAKSDYFDDSSGSSGTVNGLDAKWTAVGAAGTRTYPNGRLRYLGTAAGGASANISGIEQVAPATPYTITAKIHLPKFLTVNICSVYVRESAGGKLWSTGLFINAANFISNFCAVERYNSFTSRASAPVTLQIGQYFAWLRIVNDGTNLTAQISFDGTEYHTLLSETIATFFGAATIDRIGISVNPFSTTAPVGLFEAFVVS